MKMSPLGAASLGGMLLSLSLPAGAAPGPGIYDCRTASGQWHVVEFDAIACTVNGQPGALADADHVECRLNPMDGGMVSVYADLSFRLGAFDGLGGDGLTPGSDVQAGIDSTRGRCFPR